VTQGSKSDNCFVFCKTAKKYGGTPSKVYREVTFLPQGPWDFVSHRKQSHHSVGLTRGCNEPVPRRTHPAPLGVALAGMGPSYGGSSAELECQNQFLRRLTPGCSGAGPSSCLPRTLGYALCRDGSSRGRDSVTPPGSLAKEALLRQENSANERLAIFRRWR
jgi:hypothetical protein